MAHLGSQKSHFGRFPAFRSILETHLSNVTYHQIGQIWQTLLKNIGEKTKRTNRPNFTDGRLFFNQKLLALTRRGGRSSEVGRRGREEVGKSTEMISHKNLANSAQNNSLKYAGSVLPQGPFWRTIFVPLEKWLQDGFLSMCSQSMCSNGFESGWKVRFGVQKWENIGSNQGSVNGGFQTVVRVLFGDRFPLPPFNLNLTREGPKGSPQRGIHDQGDFWKFPLETTV